jgi:hypothetical protein
MLDADLFGDEGEPDGVSFDTSPHTIHRHHYIGRCPVRGCKVKPKASSAPWETPTSCETHGRRFRWEQVLGSYRDGIKCDARCQYAKGPACDCSCAGANHGAGWMA